MNHRLLPFTFVLVMLASFLFTGCRSRGQKAYDEAEKAYDAGDYKRAVDLFTEAAKLLPNDPALYGNRANCYSDLGNLDAALKDYETAINKALAVTKNESDPRMAYLYYNRGYALWKAGLDEKAIPDLEKTVSVNPDYPDARSVWAWILATCPDAKIRNPRKALELAGKECERTKWKNGDAIEALAASHAVSSDFKKAVEFQEKAIPLLEKEEDRRKGEERLELYKSEKPYVERKEGR